MGHERVQKMKIVFASNLYTPHQSPLSKSLKQKTDEYYFLETAKRDNKNIPIGWRLQESSPEFVIPLERLPEAKCHIDEADYLIFGSAPDALLRKRHKRCAIVLRYSERFYKKGCPAWQIPLRYVKNFFRFSIFKNEYMLCASAYTAADLAITGNFLGKTYKWGYFPKTEQYDAPMLLSKKNKKEQLSIVWAGRLIDWKHPELAVWLASELKKAGYQFLLRLIGVGELKDELLRMISDLHLEDCVHLLGEKTPEQVRKYMEESNICLVTSDFNEGWGAVVNEAMNSMCAVVASHAVGAVPFLIHDYENGLIFESGNREDLLQKVEFLFEHNEMLEKLGRNAYKTIVEQWNSEVAAERLLKMAEQLKMQGYCDLYEDGPCSRTEILRNDWYKSTGKNLQ